MNLVPMKTESCYFDVREYEGAAGMIYACNAVWGMLKCELRNSRTDKVYHPGELALSGARDGNLTTTRYRTSLRYTQELL